MKKIVFLAFPLMFFLLAMVVRLANPVITRPVETELLMEVDLRVHNTDSGKNFSTIQEAIDHNETLNGHTILVDAGIYYEHVVLDKTVSLIGENSRTTIIDGNGGGKVIMVIADNVDISGFTIRNGYYGIHLKQSNSSVLRDNNMTGNTVNFIVSGILLLRFIHDIDTSNTVDGKPVYYWVNQHHRKVPSGAGYVAIINSTNITVENLNVNKTQGVLFVHTNYSVIENVNVSSNYIGIHLIGSSNNTITGNIVANNMQFGIYLDGLFFPLGSGGEWLLSTGNNLIDNMVLKNTKSGIRLNGRAGSYVYGGNIISGNTISSNDGDGFYSISDSDIIVGNTITNNGGGITLDFSDRSTIIGNTVLNNGAGIYLSRSSGNTLRDNNVTDNKYNFGVFGDSISDFIQEIDASNIVNGKPIYYLVNQRNMAVDPLTFPDAGYLGLVNSTHITVRDLHLTSKNYQGVLFAYTNESIIEGVTSSYNKAGIWLRASTKNFVKCITSSYNQYGIQLHTSNNNVIEGVTSLYDEVGIQLRSSIDNAIKNSIVENSMLGVDLMMWSDGNIISGNTIKNNICGIQVIHSGNATIYHNNLINNTSGHVFLSSSPGNICDDGYPSGGNYWSDYNGTDANQDGIGDTAYDIDVNNQDNYPLMGMFYDFRFWDVNIVISNSTIRQFTAGYHMNSTTGTWEECIMFHVLGTEGTVGFCRVMIPREFMESPYNVLVNNEKVNATELSASNNTHVFLYFTYTHSGIVMIVPEFPIWTSMLLLFILLTVAIAIYKRRLLKTPIH